MPSAPPSLNLAAALEAAVRLVPDRGRAVLGVCGLPGAGKSTLVDELLLGVAERLGEDVVAHLPMDGFHLADAQLERLGLRERKGAPETFDVDGYAALLRRVARRPADDAARDNGEGDGGERGGGPIYVPGFERSLEQPIAAALVVPSAARLVLTEGNYLLLWDPRWRAARAAMDAVWWVEVDEAGRHTQLVARHERFGKSAAQARDWVERVDEANARLIRERSDPPDAVVDLTVSPTPSSWGDGDSRSHAADNRLPRP